jgi:hypothetical protein
MVRTRKLRVLEEPTWLGGRSLRSNGWSLTIKLGRLTATEPEMSDATTASKPLVATESPRELGRGGALEPLNQTTLIRRSLETSPTGYLGIVSIIQGVALALLTEEAHDRIANKVAPSYVILTQGLALLLILAFVFYFYTITSVLFRWPPSFMDALIPFLVGPFEIVPAYYLGEGSRWAVAVAAFFGVVIFGLGVTALYTPSEHFGIEDAADEVAARKRKAAFRHFKSLLLGVASMALITAVLTLAAGLRAGEPGGHHWRWTFVATFTVLAGLFSAVLHTEIKLVAIYEAYDIKRTIFS